jgi:hypothetical protein
MKKRVGLLGLVGRVGHRKSALKVFKAIQRYPKGLPIGPWLPVFAAPGQQFPRDFSLYLELIPKAEKIFRTLCLKVGTHDSP